jgi:uncharacterized protein YdiU (UPF0061 family)
VYSSIDHDGRYASGNQPLVAEWNLARLAEALLPLFADDEDRAIAIARDALGTFRGRYDDAWSAGMHAKLGVAGPAPVDELLVLLRDNHVDHTSFYRHLGAAARGDTEPVRGLFLDLAAIDDWLARWRAAGPDADAMARVNPVYVPRNHLVEEALTAATAGDLEPVERLLAVVTAPYDQRPGLESYATPAPEDFATMYQTFCGT